MGEIERLTAAAEEAAAGARASVQEAELRRALETAYAELRELEATLAALDVARGSRWGVLPMVRRAPLS